MYVCVCFHLVSVLLGVFIFRPALRGLLALCSHPLSLSLSQWISLGSCLASFPAESAVFLLEAIFLAAHGLWMLVLASDFTPLSSQTPSSWVP